MLICNDFFERFVARIKVKKTKIETTKFLQNFAKFDEKAKNQSFRLPVFILKNALASTGGKSWFLRPLIEIVC